MSMYSSPWELKTKHEQRFDTTEELIEHGSYKVSKKARMGSIQHRDPSCIEEGPTPTAGGPNSSEEEPAS
jgi:hypothetical protein